MADGYTTAFQKALYTHLGQDAALAELVGDRIYDEPPQSARRPYIRMNGFEPRPVRSDCGRAFEVVFSLEVHSRPRAGRVEATRVAEATEAALNGQSFAVESYEIVYLRFLTQTVDQETDGESYLANVVFEVLLDQVN